jgi:hypothetical protein
LISGAQQGEQGEAGEGGESADNQQSQAGESGEGEQQGKPDEGQPSDDQRFGSYYDDYSQNRHPEPMGSDEKGKVAEQAKEQAAAKKQPTAERALREHEQAVDAKLRAETGHSLRRLITLKSSNGSTALMRCVTSSRKLLTGWSLKSEVSAGKRTPRELCSIPTAWCKP